MPLRFFCVEMAGDGSFKSWWRLRWTRNGVGGVDSNKSISRKKPSAGSSSSALCSSCALKAVSNQASDAAIEVASDSATDASREGVNLSWADGGSEEGGDDAFEVSALAWEELIGVLDGPESVCAFFEGLPPRFGVVVDGRLPRFPAEEDSPSGVLERSARVSKGGQTGASLRRRWVITGQRGSAISPIQIPPWLVFIQAASHRPARSYSPPH